MKAFTQSFMESLKKMDKTGRILLGCLVAVLLLPFIARMIGGPTSNATLLPNRECYQSLRSGNFFKTGSDGRTLHLYGGPSLYVKYRVVNGNRLVAADGGTYVAKISIKKGKFRIYSCANSYIANSIGGTWYYY